MTEDAPITVIMRFTPFGTFSVIRPYDDPSIVKADSYPYVKEGAELTLEQILDVANTGYYGLPCWAIAVQQRLEFYLGTALPTPGSDAHRTMNLTAPVKDNFELAKEILSITQFVRETIVNTVPEASHGVYLMIDEPAK